MTSSKCSGVGEARLELRRERSGGESEWHLSEWQQIDELFKAALEHAAYFATNQNRADSGAPVKESIAVLPLKPANASNRDELYEVGVGDSLIHWLSSMKGFVVRPLSGTRKYADIEQDPD